jgi:hypothetical protein
VHGFESHTNLLIENGSQQAVVAALRSRSDVGTQTLYEQDICQPVDNETSHGVSSVESFSVPRFSKNAVARMTLRFWPNHRLTGFRLTRNEEDHRCRFGLTSAAYPNYREDAEP